MGIYKRCQHQGRARDRCEHAWWASFQHRGVLHRDCLATWANEDIRTKQHAQVVYERYRHAMRHRSGAQRHESATFDQLADWYVERYVFPRGLRTRGSIECRLRPLRAFFGAVKLRDIRIADLDNFVADLRTPRRVWRKENQLLAVATINRHIALVRHILNWAVARGYMDGTPFKRGSEPLIRLFREDNRRRRRISEEEEQRLLVAARPLLRARIVAALDTGMRRGEMLALRFGDINWLEQTLLLRGETTKSGRTRKVPVATLRLRAVLEWLRIDADGHQKGDDAFVFGNRIGEPVRDFHRSWEATILRAHGVTPERERNERWLSPHCQERLREINLHWHDLRHEYASRLVERGVPLSQVRDLLGHASIVTTERYDTHVFSALQVAAGRLEAGKTFTSASHPSGVDDQSLPGESDNSLEDKDLLDEAYQNAKGVTAKSHLGLL
jgi:integrase